MKTVYVKIDLGCRTCRNKLKDAMKQKTFVKLTIDQPHIVDFEVMDL